MISVDNKKVDVVGDHPAAASASTAAAAVTLDQTFTGTIRIKLYEASGLRPTDLQTRLKNMSFLKPEDPLLDSYVSIDVDDNILLRSATVPKTYDPVWNEYFTQDVHEANRLGLTVFHDAVIEDLFVANCKLSFSELIQREISEDQEFWVCTYNALIYQYLACAHLPTYYPVMYIYTYLFAPILRLIKQSFKC